MSEAIAANMKLKDGTKISMVADTIATMIQSAQGCVMTSFSMNPQALPGNRAKSIRKGIYSGVVDGNSTLAEKFPADAVDDEPIDLDLEVVKAGIMRTRRDFFERVALRNASFAFAVERHGFQLKNFCRHLLIRSHEVNDVVDDEFLRLA